MLKAFCHGHLNSAAYTSGRHDDLQSYYSIGQLDVISIDFLIQVLTGGKTSCSLALPELLGLLLRSPWPDTTGQPTSRPP